MTGKVKKIILFITSVFVFINARAQDVPLSQYYHNLVFINPAYVGASSNRISSFYRNQWPMSESNFKTYGLAYDQALNKYGSGLGVIVTSDNVGVFTNVSVDVIYSYKVIISKGIELRMGMQGGLVQKYKNSNQLDFGTNAEVVSGGLNKVYPDFALGGVLFYKNIYAGFSTHHINKPKSATDGSQNSRINMKFTGQLGYVIDFETSLVKQQRVIMPNVLIQQQGFQQNISWGAVFQYDYILGGLMLRHNIMSNIDVLIFSAGFKTSKMRIAYSYDMNIGKKTVIPLGAHEISLTLLYNNQKKKKYKAIGCPSFLD